MLTFKQFLAEFTIGHKKEGAVQVYTGLKPTISTVSKKPSLLDKKTVPKQKGNSNPIGGGTKATSGSRTKLTADQKCKNLRIVARRKGLAGDRARTRLKGVCSK